MSSSEKRSAKKIWSAEAWKDAAFFVKYLRPHIHIFIPGLIALAVTGGMTILYFYLLGGLVGKVLDGLRGEALVQYANHVTLLVIGVSGVQAFIAFWRIFLFAKASENALASLRRDLFSRIIRLPMATLQSLRVGELASRLANDVEVMRETLVTIIPQLIRHTVMLSASLVLLFVWSVKLSLFMIACIPVVIVLIAIFGARIRKLTRRAQDDLARSQVVVDESLQAIVSVKAFANEPFETQRYNRNLGTFLDTAIRSALPRASFVGFIIFCFSTALTLVVWFAAGMVNNGEIQHTHLVQFGAFSGLVGASFFTLPEMISGLQRALGATERVREILSDQTEPILDAPAPLKLRGAIEMRNVDFAYPSRPEAPVLRGFSFKAEAGQRIALVGPSGAGKSTVVNLLFRFYDPGEGEVLIDEKPIQSMPLSAYRKNFALVPQEVLLFGGSIRENIAYGRPGAGDDDVERAARLANAHQFIADLPDGYETVVGERGTQLSGGQRQRIAIARAILADPAILILDEATSNLDAESERLVQDALDKLMEHRTSIIIAHRLSTVRRADQILVMSGGAIVERGTHEQLVSAEHSLYATLAKLQLE